MPRGRTAHTTPADAYVARTEETPIPMKIDVSITATRNYHDDPTRARATVTLNDCFVVKGVRVMRGENGLFVSMPARRGQDGEYREMCHPITTDFARQLNASVLAEYQVYLAQQMEETQNLRHVIDPEEMQQQGEPEMDTPEQSGDAPEMDDPEQGPVMEM